MMTRFSFTELTDSNTPVFCTVTVDGTHKRLPRIPISSPCTWQVSIFSDMGSYRNAVLTERADGSLQLAAANDASICVVFPRVTRDSCLSHLPITVIEGIPIDPEAGGF